jgi:hypothetical protein
MWRRGLILVAALGLLLAACSGGESAEGIASLQDGTTTEQGSSTTAAAAVDPEQAMLDFTACMREHGVDMPDPEINSAGGGFAFGITVEGEAGEGPDNAEMQKMQEADEACRYLLEGVVQGFERPDMSEMQDQMLAFSQCMREHGVDMPDPVFSEDGSVTMFGGPGDPGMDPGDTTFQAAQEACQEVFGGGPGGMVITGNVGPAPGGEGAEGGMVVIGGDGAVPVPGGDD